MLLEWHLLPQVAFHLWGLPKVELLASHSTQCQHYYTLESPLPLEALGLNAFNHPWTFQASYLFPPAALVPLVLSKFLAEHIKDQLRQLIPVAPCWMEAPWLPQFSTCWQTFLSSAHNKRSHHGCVGRPGAQGSAISVFNPLAAQQCVLCRQGFFSSVCQAVAGATQVSMSKAYQQCWKAWAGWCA